ncbi:N-acetyltransferase family protein [Rhodocyclaceae bacterium SMB388]
MTMKHDPQPRIEQVRLHDEAHAAALLALLDDYARDVMGGGKPLSEDTRRHLIERLAERADYVGFVAFVGDEAAGLINCFEGFSTFAARPLLNVHDIAVRGKHRGRGIGTALLAAAEQVARERNCCKMTLEVLSNNHGAIATYRRAEFAPYQLDPSAGQALLMQKWL